MLKNQGYLYVQLGLLLNQYSCVNATEKITLRYDSFDKKTE